MQTLGLSTAALTARPSLTHPVAASTAPADPKLLPTAQETRQRAAKLLASVVAKNPIKWFRKTPYDNEVRQATISARFALERCKGVKGDHGLAATTLVTDLSDALDRLQAALDLRSLHLRNPKAAAQQASARQVVVPGPSSRRSTSPRAHLTGSTSSALEAQSRPLHPELPRLSFSLNITASTPRERNLLTGQSDVNQAVATLRTVLARKVPAHTLRPYATILIDGRPLQKAPLCLPSTESSHICSKDSDIAEAIGDLDNALDFWVGHLEYHMQHPLYQQMKRTADLLGRYMQRLADAHPDSSQRHRTASDRTTRPTIAHSASNHHAMAPLHKPGHREFARKTGRGRNPADQGPKLLQGTAGSVLPPRARKAVLPSARGLMGFFRR